MLVQNDIAQVVMARFVFVVFTLLVAKATSEIVEYNATPTKIADKQHLQRQIELMSLFYHINEPIHDPELKKIAESYDLGKNVEQFNNQNALKEFLQLQEYNMLLPRSVPFTILEETHKFEAVTLYNLLYSAKDYATFFKTAVYLRERINEGLFTYALAVSIMHYPETQDIYLPQLFEVFPSYFHNGQIMNIAQKLKTRGKNYVKYLPQTYVWDDNIVIRWNSTVWPYMDGDYAPLSYYLNDYALNSLYYNFRQTYPEWLSGSVKTSKKFNRGEYFWFFNKQYVNRYYLERLSNGLGEIPELSFDVIQEGYSSGLVYEGLSLPARPSHFNINQPKFVTYVEKIKILEGRIRDAIDIGYFISESGEKINLRDPEAVDILANVIDGNVDSPNPNYYGSVVNVWKELLGNTVSSSKMYWRGKAPLAVPSALELYQTTLRDPAFYMIWKRVLSLFTLWQSYLPKYKPEELAFPTVTIQKVEIDKLVTFFEYTYLNVTNALPLSENEIKSGGDQVIVLVQRPQLNHKKFMVRLNVKSEAAKTVVVRFHLGPKYDSKGNEIPLHLNTQNFFQIDQFTYALPEGETVIKRDSTQNMYMIEKWMTNYETYMTARKALNGEGEFVIDNKNNFYDGFPRRFMIPKGRIGGMPFKFFVHISEYRTPIAPSGKGVNSDDEFGIGTGCRRMTAHPLAFPLDRPLYEWQIKKLTNLRIEDVQIYHKPVPEIHVPNTLYI